MICACCHEEQRRCLREARRFVKRGKWLICTKGLRAAAVRAAMVVSLVTSVSYGVSDSLIVTVTTKTYNGRYAPKNASMMWIQKPDKTFIKTILKRAQRYIRYCTLWNSISKGDVDGLTGASRNTHGVLTARWNCTGQDNQPVPDGTYEFWVEMTESNATGKNSHGTIIIDRQAKTVNGTATAYFTNFTATYKVSPVNTVDGAGKKKVQPVLLENRNNILGLTFSVPDNYTVSVFAPNGRLCHRGSVNGARAVVDMHSFARGIHVLEVQRAGAGAFYSRTIYR